MTPREVFNIWRQRTEFRDGACDLRPKKKNYLERFEERRTNVNTCAAVTRGRTRMNEKHIGPKRVFRQATPFQRSPLIAIRRARRTRVYSTRERPSPPPRQPLPVARRGGKNIAQVARLPRAVDRRLSRRFSRNSPFSTAGKSPICSDVEHH